MRRAGRRRVRQGVPPTVDGAPESTHHAAHAAEPGEEPLRGAGGRVSRGAPPPRRGRYHPGAEEPDEEGNEEVIEAVGGHDPLVGFDGLPVRPPLAPQQ